MHIYNRLYLYIMTIIYANIPYISWHPSFNKKTRLQVQIAGHQPCVGHSQHVAHLGIPLGAGPTWWRGGIPFGTLT